MTSTAESQIGLVLSGGGARGAYQVGVLNAISQILAEEKISRNFDVYTGVSAGAINAAMLASQAEDFHVAAKVLSDLWSQITADQVFFTDPFRLGKLGLKWMSELSLGGISGSTPGRALLDTTPLGTLLKNNISYDKIQTNLDEGRLKALAITAIDYRDSSAVTFIQSRLDKGWKKARRYSEPAKISTEHILASSAIPLLFPPVKVHEKYYGDGCLRNSHPCGPSIYLGCQKLVVIGVRSMATVATERGSALSRAPSVARVLNVLLNAVLLDGVELDIERLERVNEFIRRVPQDVKGSINYKPIDYVSISPSVDIGELASAKAHRLPRMIRYLIKGLGTLEEANEIISYLLFDPDFCTQLIDIGFHDGLKNRAEIIALFTSK